MSVEECWQTAEQTAPGAAAPVRTAELTLDQKPSGHEKGSHIIFIPTYFLLCLICSGFLLIIFYNIKRMR